jgi:peptidylprolyl isomerase
MTRTRSIARSLSVLSLAAGIIAGCGGSDDSFHRGGSAIDGDPATTLPAKLAAHETPKLRQPGEPLPAQKNVTGVSTDLTKKPTVPKATGDVQTDLQGSDVVVGKGAEVKDGDKVTFEYVGQLFANGKEFDTSWRKGAKPFEFTVGQGQVIAGWDRGVPGMKVGGRRVLVIPSYLAYGVNGSPPSIPSNAPLVFVLDLKKIAKA